MNETDEKILERMKFIKKLISLNDIAYSRAVEYLREWSKEGDSLIYHYGILNYNDCIYIIDLLNTKLEYIRLIEEYTKCKEKLEI